MIPLLICTFFLCCVLVGWLTVTRARASFRLNWSEVEIKMLRADIQQLAELVESSTRRLNRLETKLDSESVDRREAGDFVWDKVKELCDTVQKIATDTEAHEANIEILRCRTAGNGNPLLWQAERKINIFAEHHTDEPPQEPPCPPTDTSTTSPSTPL